MAWFGSSKPKPVTPDPALNDFGLVDHKVKPYHCACGQEERTSTAMDAHIRSAHSGN